MTFVLSAEEMTFIVKEAYKCGVCVIAQTFVTSGDRSHDFFRIFIMSIICYKTKKPRK